MKDKCRNPVEAAGFRATMKMLALELKTAVKKGEAIEETYIDVVRSTIEVTKAMKYPGATSVEVNDILASIKDLKCNAWRKYLKGAMIMKPEDIVMDDEVPETKMIWSSRDPFWARRQQRQQRKPSINSQNCS